MKPGTDTQRWKFPGAGALVMAAMAGLLFAMLTVSAASIYAASNSEAVLYRMEWEPFPGPNAARADTVRVRLQQPPVMMKSVRVAVDTCSFNAFRNAAIVGNSWQVSFSAKCIDLSQFPVVLVEVTGANLPLTVQVDFYNGQQNPGGGPAEFFQCLSGCAPVGGVSLDPGAGALPLQSPPSSGSDGWLLTELIAGTAATAFVLGGAAIYARRRRSARDAG